MISPLRTFRTIAFMNKLSIIKLWILISLYFVHIPLERSYATQRNFTLTHITTCDLAQQGSTFMHT